MRIEAMPMQDPWAQRARGSEAEVTEHRGLDLEAVVKMDNIYVFHHGPEDNHRPALRMVGHLETLRSLDEPLEDEPEDGADTGAGHMLPHGIEELTWRPGTGPTIDGIYEFTHEQLVALVGRGYFQKESGLIEQVTVGRFELPVRADLAVVHPGPEEEAGVPVVFVEVRDRNSLRLSEESTGYDLVEAFVDLSPRIDELEAEQDLSLAPERVSNHLQRDDIFQDLVLEDIPEEQGPLEVEAEDENPVLPSLFGDTAFERELAKMQVDDKARAERIRATSEDGGRDEVDELGLAEILKPFAASNPQDSVEEGEEVPGTVASEAEYGDIELELDDEGEPIFTSSERNAGDDARRRAQARRQAAQRVQQDVVREQDQQRMGAAARDKSDDKELGL